MGRCYFEKIGFAFVLFTFLGGTPVMANCPLADQFLKENKQEQALWASLVCATHYNDDVSQMRLAENFLRGTNGAEKDELQALYMYHLAAENGNAQAQLKLAKMLRSFDSTPERREQLMQYQSKLVRLSPETDGFQGEIYHPYTLMLLASEKAENKWYYPSSEKAPPKDIASELRNYQVNSQIQQAAIKDASKWKTRTLLKVAKEILGADEYPLFENQLKNPATREKTMIELRKRYDKYVADKKKGMSSKP